MSWWRIYHIISFLSTVLVLGFPTSIKFLFSCAMEIHSHLFCVIFLQSNQEFPQLPYWLLSFREHKCSRDERVDLVPLTQPGGPPIQCLLVLDYCWGSFFTFYTLDMRVLTMTIQVSIRIGTTVQLRNLY